MRRKQRAYKNPQTANVAEYVLDNVEAALDYRETFLSETTEGFKFIGQGFVLEVAKCDCGKVEGIDWEQIDEIFQYDLQTIINDEASKEEEVEVEPEVVVEAELPVKTLEVSDKVVDEAVDPQLSTEAIDDPVDSIKVEDAGPDQLTNEA